MRTSLVLMLTLIATCTAAGYSTEDAAKFVGAQHWWESGLYLDGGLKEHYDGYYCMCSCNATAEGIFCKGGGFSKSETLVGNFMAVYSQSASSKWIGTILSYGTTNHFVDSFSQDCPGCGANYTGVSQSAAPKPFVWRGYMSGVDCQYRNVCPLCSVSPDYMKWNNSCRN